MRPPKPALSGVQYTVRYTSGMSEVGTPVLLSAQVREIERLAQSSMPGESLMERAGRAVAALAQQCLGERGKRILLMAGPGNNGGDAFVAARHLKQAWFDLQVAFLGDAARLPADARAAMQAWREAGGATHIGDACLGELSRSRPALIVDGLFGIGLRRPLEAPYASAIEAVNASGIPVLAIDVPSGLDADTGRVLGHAIRARHTITFLGLKPGLLTLDGPDHAGQIHVDDLGQQVRVPDPGGATIAPGIVRQALPSRRRNSHKGSFGTVAVIGGAEGMVGAALLAGRAALKLGAGKVRIGLLADNPVVDPAQPELMLRPVQDVLAMPDVNCIAAGPGLGMSEAAFHALGKVVSKPLPLVLDADALNLVAAETSLRDALLQRASPTLLTPHPAEAARLLGVKTADVQADRVAAAQELARRHSAIVVLKGAGSICALPDGNWRVNTTGNPGMASAGMGDVLTGMIVALISQGATPALAMFAAVHLHGAAADHLATTGIGPVGMTASELIDAARHCLNGA